MTIGDWHHVLTLQGLRRSPISGADAGATRPTGAGRHGLGTAARMDAHPTRRYRSLLVDLLPGRLRIGEQCALA